MPEIEVTQHQLQRYRRSVEGYIAWWNPKCGSLIDSNHGVRFQGKPRQSALDDWQVICWKDLGVIASLMRDMCLQLEV